MKKMILLLIVLFCFSGCAKQETKKEKVDLDTILTFTSKEELAAYLNCDVNDLELLGEYTNVMNKYLRYSNEEDKQEYERGVTDCDEKWISAEELRSLTDRVILTKNNWKNYLVPQIKQTEFCEYDFETNESTCEWGDTYVIDWIDDYYANDDTVLILKNKDSGEEIIFDGYWPEYVSYEDGKFIVITYDSDSNQISKEFNADNYECIEAHGILYKDNVPQEMLYYGNNSMSGDPFFDYQYIYIKYDDDTIWQEWLPGVGKLVFEH